MGRERKTIKLLTASEADDLSESLPRLHVFMYEARLPFPRVHFASCAFHSRGPSQQTFLQVYSEGQLCTRSGQRVEDLIPRYQQKARWTILTPRVIQLDIWPCPVADESTCLTRKRWAVVCRESWDSPVSIVLRKLVQQRCSRST